MNTFWLKVAGVGVLAVVVLVVAGQFAGGDKKATVQEENLPSGSVNVYEQDEKDHERLNAPIEVAPVQVVATVDEVQPEPTPQPLPQFVKLSIDQQVAADDLWTMAEQSFKIGRKPMMTFGQCVKYCRQIIQQFPGTEYEIKAKRMLNDVVEINDRYKEQFHITDEELEMGPYQ